jgi:hypothetical protein
VVAQVAKDNRLKEKVQEAKDSSAKQKPPLIKKSSPMRDNIPYPQLKDPLKEVACKGSKGSPTHDKAIMDMAENTPSKYQKRQGVKHKAPKQKPLTKPIRPIGDHVAKKMKDWDVITKQTNRSKGLSLKNQTFMMDHILMTNWTISHCPIPKVVTKVQEWSKDSI